MDIEHFEEFEDLAGMEMGGEPLKRN